MKKKYISGIFSDLLKKAAPWFLYIFIDKNANLPRAIMTKRKNQLYWLSQIDKINTYYNFSQLVEIIRDGIYEKYKLTPNRVLSVIYNVNVNGISGISEADTAVYTGSHFDGEKWVDDITGDVLSEAEQNSSTELAQQLISEKSTGTSSDFWKGLKDVIEWIVSLLKTLGVNVNSKVSTYTPTSSDWSALDGSYSSASMSGALPYVVGGVIVYYLFTTGMKKSSKAKS